MLEVQRAGARRKIPEIIEFGPSEMCIWLKKRAQQQTSVSGAYHSALAK